MPETETQLNVATPLKIRWRRACTQLLPLAFFVFLCGSCLLLWQYQNRSIVQIGEVETIDYSVTSPASGIVAGWSTTNGESLPIFSKVTQGQIIIELDDGTLVENIQSIRSRLKTIGNSADAKIAYIQENGADSRLVSTSPMPNAADTKVEDAEPPMKPWKKLAAFTKRAATQTEVAELQLEQRKTESQIRALRQANLSTDEKTKQMLVLNEQKLEQAAKMQALRVELASGELISIADLETIDESNFSDADRLLFQSAAQRCEVADQQISQLEKSIPQLDIRSPINGQLEKAFVNQYDAVVAGTPVASVVPTEGKVVVVYAREIGPIRPFAGMPVVLTSVTNRLLRAETFVSSVGPKIESIPARQRANPRIEEWGRPMRIEIPSKFVVEPGALVNVAFDLNRPTR